ncbi:hypothetical protein WJX73_002567 [Symbiochloris irregularis]|uniref:Aminotransferase class I/classII large domain-containing protein n=1 Tax=Symbiochloris irregularis TaxID=706552 RepID=A0AAW1P9J9_9CHLO
MLLTRLCTRLCLRYGSFAERQYASASGASLQTVVREQLDNVKLAGLFKEELSFTGQQAPVIVFEEDDREVINFCSSNYLGLANHPELIKAARAALDSHGLGMSSMRYICGTTNLHRQLEAKISEFHGTEDTMIYPSCSDANMGLFQAILTDEDAVISDQLNHGSTIDGMRLCKAKRHRYAHADMEDLEDTLKEAADARLRLIVTDGVFSMTGEMAPLQQICDLAERYNAVVLVDDCQGTGVVGPSGRGSLEACGVQGRVQILNSTLGKALGGVNGGYTTGSTDVIECLRQCSRPYIFSNSLSPPLVGACIAAFDMVSSSHTQRKRLLENAKNFRSRMQQAGFDLKEGVPHIVPIMLGDSELANEMAKGMLKKGIYVRLGVIE